MPLVQASSFHDGSSLRRTRASRLWPHQGEEGDRAERDDHHQLEIVHIGDHRRLGLDLLIQNRQRRGLIGAHPAHSRQRLGEIGVERIEARDEFAEEALLLCRS